MLWNIGGYIIMLLITPLSLCFDLCTVLEQYYIYKFYEKTYIPKGREVLKHFYC